MINDRPILQDVAEVPEFSDDVMGCIAHSPGILPLLGLGFGLPMSFYRETRPNQEAESLKALFQRRSPSGGSLERSCLSKLNTSPCSSVTTIPTPPPHPPQTARLHRAAIA